MKSWTVIVLLLAGTIAFPQGLTSVALQRLKTTEVFAFGGIGFAGTTSEGEKAFKVVMSLSHDKAIAAFESLYTTGNPQAKGYALAGLRKLDKMKFNALFKSAVTSNLRVRTENGCFISDHSLGEIAKSLDSGKYDLWIQ